MKILYLEKISVTFILQNNITMATPTMNLSATKTNTAANLSQPIMAHLSTLIVVFFFWGFIAAGNSVFIPFCKHYFHLDQFQSQLIDFAFYLAYYIGRCIVCLWRIWRKRSCCEMGL